MNGLFPLVFEVDEFRLLTAIGLGFLFGFTLERMYGSGEFLRFYLTAAFAASLAHIGLALVTGERERCASLAASAISSVCCRSSG